MNQDRLDHLKQEYDAIPVPPELEERVRAAIRQARPAGEKPPRVLRLDRFLRRTGLSAAAAMLAVVLLANSGPGIAHAMEQVPVLGAITRVFTFRTYEEDRGNTSAHIDIPSVEGGGDALSAAIQAYTDTIIQQYQYEACLLYTSSGCWARRRPHGPGWSPAGPAPPQRTGACRTGSSARPHSPGRPG